MSNKIITSSREISRRPWLAAAMSFFVPGLGQIYNAAAARGAAFMLIRALPLWVLPFYFMLSAPASVVPGFFAAHLAIMASTLAAVIDAALGAKKKPKIIPAWYNRVAVYTLCALAATVLTAASSAVMYSCFTPYVAGDSARGPLIAQGDLIVANRLAPRKYSSGDQVMLADGSVWRIIAAGPDRVMIINGTIVINGEPLKRSVPGDAEARTMHFSSPANIYREENRGARYAVEQNMDESKGTVSIAMKKDEFLAARDLRLKTGWHRVIGQGEISGRAETLVRWTMPASFTLPSFFEKK